MPPLSYRLLPLQSSTPTAAKHDNLEEAMEEAMLVAGKLTAIRAEDRRFVTRSLPSPTERCRLPVARP